MNHRHRFTDEVTHESLFQSSRSMRHFGDKIHRAIQHDRLDMAADYLEELFKYAEQFEEQIEKAEDWTDKVRGGAS